MLTTLPTRPRGFNVIVEGIPDSNPMGKVKIPTQWISQLLIDLGLGKMKVSQGITIHSRGGEGCPRRYFMGVVVQFENTINEEMRTALEGGQDIQLIYQEKGEPHHRTGVKAKRDKFLTIKQYKALEEAERAIKARTQQAKVDNASRSKTCSERQRKGQSGKQKNMFDCLNVDE